MTIYLATLALIIGGAADAFFLHHGNGVIALACGVAISTVMTARAVARAAA
jgi:hypothetical protein